MNLNDLRSKAYTSNSSENEAKNNKKDSGAEVKISAFVPRKLTKEDFQKENKAAAAKNSGLKTDTTEIKNDFSSVENKSSAENWNQTGIKNQISGKKSGQSASQQLDNTVNYLKTGGLLKVPVEKPQSDGKESVYRRVAKFLLIIGEDEAAKVMPHLSEKQIEKIIPEIASIRTVSKDEAAVIMAEFQGLLENAKKSGGVETAREMLVKAYGKEKADSMMEKAVPFEGEKPFDYLNDADSERIYLLLKDENAGVKSLVLSYLEPKKAASVINQMKDAEKKEVVLRLAKMEAVSPDILRRVNQAMHEKSLRQTTEKAENIDGRNALAQILKKMDAGTETDILNTLAQDDPDLGQDLRTRLFTMDDVIKADDRFIQEKLREMADSDIAYLITSKPSDFRNKILDNMSSTRKSEILTQEDILKPMRRADCERITSEFFSVLRRAYEEGHLIIDGRNDDVYV